ncbi:MAG: hypothetical protein K8I27_10960 [Planctomycetes bacterium]|nr:hypothetical protein [Planctomycetota bacterium]
MAQRILSCPSCATPLEVPDHYMRAGIKCPFCHVTMDCRTGELLAGAAAPPPQYAPQYTPQSNLAYPGQLHGYEQRLHEATPSRGFPRWAIALIVGVVLLAGAGAAAGVWGVAKAGAAREEMQRVPPTEDWATYTDPAGHFTARFPGHPQASTSVNTNGLETNEVVFDSPAGRWELGWLDLPSGATFQLHDVLEEIAQGLGGRVTNSRSAPHQDCPGFYGEVGVKIGGGQIRVQVFQSGRRIYAVVSESRTESFAYFLENVCLTDLGLGIKPLELLPFDMPVLYEEMPLSQDILLCWARGGMPPYTYTVDDTPPGLKP